MSSSEHSSYLHSYEDSDRSGPSCSDHDADSLDEYHSFNGHEDGIDEENDEHSQSSESSSNDDADDEDGDDDILEENNNDPNNNQGNENEGDEGGEEQEVVVPMVVNIPTSPRPGCSKDFDSIDSGSRGSLTNPQINRLATHVLKHISRLTHGSIVASIEKAQSKGNKKISLSDLLSENNDKKYNRPLLGKKRTNTEDICLIEMKRSTHNERPLAPGSPILAGFIVNNPIIDLTRLNNVSEFTNSPPPEIVLDSSEVHVLDVSPVPHAIGNRLENRRVISPIDCHPSLPKIPKTNPIGKSNAALNPLIRFKEPPAATETHNYGTIPKTVNSQFQNAASGSSSNSKHPATVTSNSLARPGADFIRNRTMDNMATLVAKMSADYKEMQKIKVRQIREANQEQRGHIYHPQELLRPKIPTIVPTQPATDPRPRVESLLPQVPQAPLPATVSAAPPHNGQVCQEIYQKLRAIFPNLKKSYIRKFCPSDWTADIGRDVQFGSIVDKLFANEASWRIREDDFMNRPSTSNNANNGAVPNVDETCEYLAGIFRDADPHYLRDAAMGFKDQNAVEAFVEQNLQKPDYPTREQYMAKLKITQEQERYTTHFVVADFVKIFPDPFTHFEDPKRICIYDLVSFEFLKSIYCRLRVSTISKAYSQNHYNMSLAAKQLNECHDYMQSRRRNREMLTEAIPMLQEMAFIRHQDEIRKYIESIRQEEHKEFEKLKAQGGLLQCQCCYDEECMPAKCSTCDNDHIFCNTCVIRGTDTKLGDGETHVPCFLACGSEFSLSTLQKILVPTKFSILLKKRQAAEVMAAGLEGLVSCPFCHFASIPAEGDKVFKCLNPECMKESCIQCKEPNHVPLRCDEVQKQDKARKYIEEKMTQALARTCYKCKKSFFKDEGCNKITCPCGAIMCFICDKPIKNYSHFRGQGSNDANKCPLWSDNNRLNAEAVIKVAEEARSELLRADPSLHINTAALAPTLPPPSAGPHTDIPGADNIAIQLAARVMKANRQ